MNAPLSRPPVWTAVIALFPYDVSTRRDRAPAWPDDIDARSETEDEIEHSSRQPWVGCRYGLRCRWGRTEVSGGSTWGM